MAWQGCHGLSDPFGIWLGCRKEELWQARLRCQAYLSIAIYHFWRLALATTHLKAELTFTRHPHQ